MKITDKKHKTVWVLTSNAFHDGPVGIVGVYADKESAQKEYDSRYEDMCARWLSLDMKEHEVIE